MGKFTPYKLPLMSLPEGEKAYSWHLDKAFFDNMESDDVRDASVDVALRLTHRHEAYDLAFTMTGEVTVPCDRCLDDLVLPVDTKYHVVVKYGDDYREGDNETMEIPSTDADLNVAYMIYDTVALTIPLKHVHPLGKCNRAMTSLLKKHRAAAADPDAELEEELIDEMDSMESPAVKSNDADGGDNE